MLDLPANKTSLAGLELNLGLEIGLWLPVGPGLKHRSQRPGR